MTLDKSQYEFRNSVKSRCVVDPSELLSSRVTPVRLEERGWRLPRRRSHPKSDIFCSSGENYGGRTLLFFKNEVFTFLPLHSTLATKGALNPVRRDLCSVDFFS